MRESLVMLDPKELAFGAGVATDAHVISDSYARGFEHTHAEEIGAPVAVGGRGIGTGAEVC